VFSELESLIHRINNSNDYSITGSVSGVKGLLIKAKGLNLFASIGSICSLTLRSGESVEAEVVGFEENETLLLAYGDTTGIGIGCEILLNSIEQNVFPSMAWKGRVINCFAEPVDKKGDLQYGSMPYNIKAAPVKAHERMRVKDKLDMGVRAVNTFVTCCKGQRLGIFAGSGVGKSMLLSMFTKYAKTDIKVIGLIGERGREVQEFIEDYLGEEGLANAVIIVATSDESALARKRAAYLTLSVSEYFRDQGLDVITMMDSVTRFAMAQREIGLAVGEPSTTKGYTPSVFSELPKLLERAGMGNDEQGSITGLFSVLVEGDDTNEPVADAIRSILDGHIVLSREIAARNRFPAIDILKSISRMMPMCNTDAENQIVNTAKKHLALYDEMVDLIKIGAYKKGTDLETDLAIEHFGKIEEVLKQSPNESDNLEMSYEKLGSALARDEVEKISV
jgi:flagellum-specific ATP synthase